MDEPQKSPFSPVPVRWFKVPMDGMKRGFAHLKKQVDRLVQIDQIRTLYSTSEQAPIILGDPTEEDSGRQPDQSVGRHLNTYA